MPESDDQLVFLVVDDHAIVRKGVVDTIVSEFPGSLCKEASNVSQAMQLLHEKTPDLTILDISMPGASGIDFLKAARQLKPNLKVLIFSMHSEEEYAVRTLKAGASGYLVKGSSPHELIGAMRQVLDGATYASPQITGKLIAEVRNDPNRAPHECLSNREFEILRLIGQGKSVKDITWELALSENTVRTYRARIFTKMNLKTSAELIRYVLENNLA